MLKLIRLNKIVSRVIGESIFNKQKCVSNNPVFSAILSKNKCVAHSFMFCTHVKVESSDICGLNKGDFTVRRCNKYNVMNIDIF